MIRITNAELCNSCYYTVEYAPNQTALVRILGTLAGKGISVQLIDAETLEQRLPDFNGHVGEYNDLVHGRQKIDRDAPYVMEPLLAKYGDGYMRYAAVLFEFEDSHAFHGHKCGEPAKGIPDLPVTDDLRGRYWMSLQNGLSQAVVRCPTYVVYGGEFIHGKDGRFEVDYEEDEVEYEED